MGRSVAAICLWLLAGLASAQSDARNEMGVPASTIFKGMLRFAAAGEASKLEKSLALLKPVLGEHEATFGATATDTVVERVRSRQPEVAADGVRELIARDAVVLLRAVPAANIDRARTLSRTAALEWRILEEELAPADPARVSPPDFKAVFDAVETRDAARIRMTIGRAEKPLLAISSHGK